MQTFTVKQICPVCNNSKPLSSWIDFLAKDFNHIEGKIRKIGE